MAATGISAASTVRIGNLIGKSDGINLSRSGKANFILALVVMTIFALTFVIVHDLAPRLYIDDPEVVQLASTLIIVAGFFQLSDGVHVVGLGSLRGMSDVRIPTVITLISYWGLAIPVSYVFGFVLGYGPQGIWYGLCAGLTMAAILLYFRFVKLAKKQALIFEKTQNQRNP